MMAHILHLYIHTKTEVYDNVEKLTSNPGMAWGAVATSSRGSSQHSSGPAISPRATLKTAQEETKENEPLRSSRSPVAFISRAHQKEITRR
ncbi:hypothetical protein QE152_g31934 [Popillia japonica]|uniref:Uncharacterized protein n=1 Tax=Popillia japonica TaxID=7064 RepID=A0AAW1J1C3_POPJA